MRKTSSSIATLFLILSVLFLVYGVYAVIASVQYLNVYTTSATMSASGTIQYIVTASASYFGFGIVMLGISQTITRLDAIANACSGGSKAVSQEDESEVHVDFTKYETESSIPVAAIIENSPELEVSEVISEPEIEIAVQPQDSEPVAQLEIQLQEPEFEVEYIYADTDFTPYSEEKEIETEVETEVEEKKVELEIEDTVSDELIKNIFHSAPDVLASLNENQTPAQVKEEVPTQAPEKVPVKEPDEIPAAESVQETEDKPEEPSNPKLVTSATEAEISLDFEKVMKSLYN